MVFDHLTSIPGNSQKKFSGENCKNWSKHIWWAPQCLLPPTEFLMIYQLFCYINTWKTHNNNNNCDNNNNNNLLKEQQWGKRLMGKNRHWERTHPLIKLNLPDFWPLQQEYRRNSLVSCSYNKWIWWRQIENKEVIQFIWTESFRVHIESFSISAWLYKSYL